MPTYVYACGRCDLTEEVARKMSEMSDPLPCRDCGQKMERVISSTSFVLKGTGWARDGYGGK